MSALTGYIDSELDLVNLFTRKLASTKKKKADLEYNTSQNKSS